MINGIYTITSEGKTGYYFAENFAEPEQLLPILWSVHTAKDRIPELRLSAAQQLISYSKGLLPISSTPGYHLFQPLEQEQFAQLKEDLLDGDANLCHYTLDYDGDRFAMTSWGEDGMETLSTSLESVISACATAQREKRSGRPYFDRRLLTRAFHDIFTAEPGPKALELTETAGPELSM